MVDNKEITLENLDEKLSKLKEEYKEEHAIAVAEEEEQMEKEYAEKNKEHPQLLIVYNPKVDFGIDYAVEIWDENENCEHCNKKGCYKLRDDRLVIGVCRKHLEEEARTTQKTIIKVLELPIGHKY